MNNIVQILKNKNLLIVIDNIENALHRDEHNFKVFLEILLDDCPKVKILTTSRAFLKGLGNNEEIIHTIQPLNTG